MTSEGAKPPSFNDMLDTWRQTAAESEQRWNDFLNQMMGTEAFGSVMARSMDGYLSMQSTFSRRMEQYLQALNIPTRTDIAQLAERVAMLEQKIDTMALVLGSGGDSEGTGQARVESAAPKRRGGRRRAPKTEQS